MSSPSQPPPGSRDSLIDRLKRIEGQVRGVQRMVEQGRSCAEILPQLSAVLAATKRVALLLAFCSIDERLEEAVEAGSDPREAVSDLLELLTRLP
ncbi:MAG: metal-sensitive transcriptional regulator [Armatimonadetes bacterium]|nr:metal-sensitive transcriptional regulator [Armatimonadota bacterium]